MRNIFFLILSCFCLLSVHAQNETSKDHISLAGIWNFKLDPLNVSIPVKGSNFVSKFPEEITLPGSTDQAGKGFKTQDMSSLRLTRMFEYSGAAWYEKENIFIPESWKDQQLFLFLERVHWESQVWINGKFVGKEESLSTPHLYDITSYVKFGDWNTVRIRVDNGNIHDIAYTHAISAETQTNWNGIIGRMEIQAVSKVHIADVQIYPLQKEKRLKIVAQIVNYSNLPVKGDIRINCHFLNDSQDLHLKEKNTTFNSSDSLIHLVHYYDLGDKLYTWDEFEPNLYEIDYEIKCCGKSDVRKIKFGIRDFGTKGTHFTINDIPTFIRGAVNSCEFPITGYPPMSYEEWKKVMKVYNCLLYTSPSPRD